MAGPNPLNTFERRPARGVIGTILFVVAVGLTASTIAQEPAPWKMETLVLQNGARIQGLLVEQTERGYLFRQVIRKSGSPTITGTEEYSRAEVASFEALGMAERDELKRKLAELDRQRQLFLAGLRQLDQAGEKSSIDGLKLRRKDWQGRAGVPGWAFSSGHFELETDAREPIAALVALQLEELFRAISRLIPPRIQGKPTTILVWSDRAQYLEAVSKNRITLAHPAFFDSASNRILVGTDLAKIEKESQSIRIHHQGQTAVLNQRELEIARAFGGKPTLEYQELFKRMRRELREAEVQNEAMVRKARQHLLQVINHEAIHAYLVNWVFPPATQPLPRWLNEGLAQVFESAFIEAGELRANWPDPARLAAVRTLLKENRFPPLARILTAAPDHFLARNPGQTADLVASSEAYLASWVLTYYLTFEKRRIPGKTLDDYLARLARNEDPVEAFQVWNGETVGVFEVKFHEWIRQVRPDGTVPKPPS